MLICTTFHKQHRDTFTIPQMLYKHLVMFQGNQIHLSVKFESMTTLGRAALDRQTPGAPPFQGVETVLGYNGSHTRELSHGKFHTSVLDLPPKRKTGESILCNGL